MADAYLQYDLDEHDILTITMNDAARRVNVMNGAFLQALSDMADKLEAEKDSYKGVILTSAKRTFFAGGDLEEILHVNASNRRAYFDKVQGIKANFRRLEQTQLPIVAAINGAALGGGYEICLACSYRIAIDSPDMRIGLPEVTLGLLPGGGGVIRLTRKVGFVNALPYLMTGKSVSAPDALTSGLIEAIAPDRDAMMKAARRWILNNPSSVRPWDKKDFKVPGGALSSPLVTAAIDRTEQEIADGKYVSGPAPNAILSCAIDSLINEFDEASILETQYLTDLAISASAKEKIAAFFEKSRPKAEVTA